MAKTLLKIVIILVLVGIIIGVSYFKSDLSARRSESQLQIKTAEYVKARDSLLAVQLKDTTRFYLDSIRSLESYYQDKIDSLNIKFGIIDSSTLAPQKQELLLTGADVVKMMAEYDSLRKELPRKMTADERKEALQRLSVKLTRKYSIEPDSVKKIIGAGD